MYVNFQGHNRYKTVRNDENQPLHERFSTNGCQIYTVDVKLDNLKDIKALLPWLQNCPLKKKPLFLKIVRL